MMRLSDLLLVSDVDGTALVSGRKVPERNLRAVRRFMDKGGRFTFATGRSLKMLRLAIDEYPVNAPAICLNGSLICDPGTGETFVRRALPGSVLADIRRIIQRFDGECGVMAVGEENYYAVAHAEESMRVCLSNTLAGPAPARLEDIREPLFKALVMTVDPAQTREARRWMGEQFCERYSVVQSGERIVELMEKDVSKGQALPRLAELTGTDMRCVAAIGDSENDLEMLRAAGLSAAPGDADPAIRSVAGTVLCPCLDGALGMFIETLEKAFAL